MKNNIISILLAIIIAFSCMTMSFALYKGDVDQNGEITAVDARMILRAVAGLDVLDENQKNIADVDGNGDIGATDARCVLRIVAGLESDLNEVTEYIKFNDVFLENYVKQALGITGTDKVSKQDMSKLTEFEIKEGIIDAQDLKFAINLRSISINADNVKNLDVLCNLLKITDVSFGFQKKIDISFMENMNNVERIYYNNSEIVGGSISYLVSSSKLKDLFYYNPHGSGIDFLEGANSLENIELWHAFGENSDISVLTTLPKLKSLEILTYNSTSDSQRAVYAELISKGVSVNFI